MKKQFILSFTDQDPDLGSCYLAIETKTKEILTKNKDKDFVKKEMKDLGIEQNQSKQLNPIIPDSYKEAYSNYLAKKEAEEKEIKEKERKYYYGLEISLCKNQQPNRVGWYIYSDETKVQVLTKVFSDNGVLYYTNRYGIKELAKTTNFWSQEIRFILSNDRIVFRDDDRLLYDDQYTDGTLTLED